MLFNDDVLRYYHEGIPDPEIKELLSPPSLNIAATREPNTEGNTSIHNTAIPGAIKRKLCSPTLVIRVHLQRRHDLQPHCLSTSEQCRLCNWLVWEFLEQWQPRLSKLYCADEEDWEERMIWMQVRQ
jgi:hypothetical protein